MVKIMKRICQKSKYEILLSLFLSMVGQDCFAYDFEAGGLYYNYVTNYGGTEVVVTRIDISLRLS